MNCLVTGAAGFIGSHLAEALLSTEHSVVGVDCFTNHYPRALKEKNMSNVGEHPDFTFVGANLAHVDLSPLLRRMNWVFHNAAQPGVRASWGRQFHVYMECNVLATQRLLEAIKGTSLRKFIYASSSSVYGDTEVLPTREDAPTRPISPYGVTKLAGENLCYLYCKNFGIPVVSLRYFTVYGPRQRPDMALQLFITSILQGKEILVYGDGLQTRDFTFVSDVVQANLLAAEHEDIEGQVMNIAGGSRATISEVIHILESITGRQAKIRYVDKQKGDVHDTFADIGKASELLGYHPTVDLREGLQRQVNWVRSLIDSTTQ